MADETFVSSEIALAFIIIGILLFVVEVFQPGFLVAVPGTVFIVLGILMSFDDALGLSPFMLLVIGLVVGGGSLWGTMAMYQSLAPPDTPSEMSIESMIGKSAVVTKDVPGHALIYGNPASQHGWICECGWKLDSNYHCSQCRKKLNLP